MIIDFRLRPPYKDFLSTAQYNLKRNAAVSKRFGMWQAESVKQCSMELFLGKGNHALGLSAGFEGFRRFKHCAN